MSTSVYTSPITREEIKGIVINCPDCNSPMLVENIYKKNNNRFEGTTSTCINGCKDKASAAPYDKLIFYSYDIASVIDKINRYATNR